MWGKLQNYAHQGVNLMKGGIARASHAYNKASHIAGELSGMWDVGKQLGGVLARYGDAKMGGRQLTDALDQGVHWGDALRSRAVQKHDDVLGEIQEMGTMYKQLGNILNQGYNGQYTGG